MTTETTLQESGADTLRRVVRVLDMTRESAHDDYTPEQLLNIVRAIWASDWEFLSDDWPEDALRLAAAGQIEIAAKKANAYFEIETAAGRL